MAVISNHVSMNYSQFSSLFKRYTGSNFQDHLRGLRIAHAKQLLRSTGLTIRQISEASGFRSEKHFMRSFKQVVAISPGGYRRNARISGE
jgi:transcriptional regulator GlxA family with amidase domain